MKTACRFGHIGSKERVYSDKAIERERLSKKMLCDNIEDGCKWAGDVCHFKAHLSECDFEKISCINAGQGCKAAICRKNLANHLQSDCDYRPVTCQWCEETTPHKDHKAHRQTCPAAPVRCDWCGKKGLTRAQLQEHQQPDTGSCPNMKTACGFELLGCTERVDRRYIEDHHQKFLVAHQELLITRIRDIETNVSQQANHPATDVHVDDTVMPRPEQLLGTAPTTASCATSGAPVEQETSNPEHQRGRIIELEKELAMLKRLECILRKRIELLSHPDRQASKSARRGKN